MQTGDKIVFSNYEWRVLDIQNNTALIITENIIEWRPYHDRYIGITWADCALRKYLNGEFCNQFSETDKAKILLVTNKNLDNQWYGTKGGEETQDSIFLLSIEEAVCKYFGDSSALLHNPGKNQRYWFQRKDENNSKRCARRPDESWHSWWWLRSPGRVSVKAVYIHGDGNIGIHGNNILKGNIDEGEHEGGRGGGVRPALWLKL
jgi:hypothetical protein